MFIKIVKKLTPSHIDARSDLFKPGCQYEVGNAIGQLFIAEGWAIVERDPVLMGPLVEQNSAHRHCTTEHGEWRVPSLKDVIAADIALDDVMAEAIERQSRPLDD